MGTSKHGEKYWLGHLHWPCFQIRAHSQVLGIRISAHLFQEHNWSHHRGYRIMSLFFENRTAIYYSILYIIPFYRCSIIKISIQAKKFKWLYSVLVKIWRNVYTFIFIQLAWPLLDTILLGWVILLPLRGTLCQDEWRLILQTHQARVSDICMGVL